MAGGSDAERDLVAALRRWSEPLPPPEARNFADPFGDFGGARVVLLGEATHGTAEFYQARAAITRHLIERHGFSIVAVEADWPDAAQIDAHIRGRPAAPLPEPPFARFPSWMWRNAEMAAFIAWLRAHNASLPERERVEFRGLDIYSLGASIAAVLQSLEETDPAEAKAARERYGCLSPWQAEPQRYGRAVMFGKHPCEDKVVEQLGRLLGARLSGHPDRDFDAVQNARVVRAAEQYYRAMYLGSTESWNLRDRHMFETLQALLANRPGARAVVWAHNSHIGHAAATDMGWRGQFNIGELCRAAFSEDAVLVGFGTDRGQVAAASDWDGPMEFKAVRPARGDSHEALFREAGLGRSLTRLREAECRKTLAEPRLERAIGVIYRPETEFESHYFEAVLPEQFDAYVWFEQTGAVTPLPGPQPGGEPDTFPFGI
ncbi:erythromycin esterase family protein [Belnapia sp. T6]|uniref:Erythromycin esterase family protein n=1 Tax=Belnapia mucosa TaxID=2804532 RepID=A0ABS1V2M2_9PROT|nr:erythromycin esterase family protein [Belnapia mucosa]MBL6455817.1 erythromycin esterase family protein [Belnapia mucosa]